MKILNYIKNKSIYLFLGLIIIILVIIRFNSQSQILPTASQQPVPIVSPSPQVISPVEMAEEQTLETQKLYPLIEYLPIDNNRYHLTYSDAFELKITIKQGLEEEIKQEILDWITSKNIDPASHTLIIE